MSFWVFFFFYCLLSEPTPKHLQEMIYGSEGRSFAVSGACFASRDLYLSRSAEWIALKKVKYINFENKEDSDMGGKCMHLLFASTVRSRLCSAFQPDKSLPSF